MGVEGARCECQDPVEPEAGIAFVADVGVPPRVEDVEEGHLVERDPQVDAFVDVAVVAGIAGEVLLGELLENVETVVAAAVAAVGIAGVVPLGEAFEIVAHLVAACAFEVVLGGEEVEVGLAWADLVVGVVLALADLA